MDSYSLIRDIHIYSVYASGFLMVFYLILTQSKCGEFDYIKRIRVFLPTYYMFLAIMFFTGILCQAILSFIIDKNIITMIVSFFAILYLAILQFSLFKKARRMRSYKKFRGQSFLILVLSIFLIVFSSLKLADKFF